MKTHVKKKLDIHGIRFASWLTFLLFGIFIIAFLWLTQVVFLQVYVNNTKQTEFATVANNLLGEYRYAFSDYRKSFDRISNETGCMVDVVQITDSQGVVQYSSAWARYSDKTQAVPFSLHGGIRTIAENAQYEHGYYIKDDNAMQLMYGVYLDKDQTQLLVVSQSTQLLESTTRILRIQMIIATVVIIVLSFCISFILSSAFSQDLRRLSDEAKRLSEDDYSVYFDEKGFSEAKELARTLNYATSEIRKTDELRRELISNVSHDLRTPLTIIKGYAEMIRDLSGDDAEKRAEQLDIIIKETDRLSGLVNDILQLSRAQNQNAPIEKAAFDLGATVKRVGKSFDLLTLRDGYDIRIEAADNCMVLGNEQQLELVVYNLIGNAVNYTGADKKVYVQVAKEKGLVMLKVRDTGAGMDEEQLRHIWQRYYRADEHIRSVVGTGLGLSIVQSILNRHEAQFGVESTVGNGSTFWFALPDVSLQEQA